MKRLIKVVKFLGVAALVIAVAIGISNVVLGRRVEKELMAIKASGAPIALTELGEPKVPDSENGAIIYAKVIEGLTGMVLNPNGGPALKQMTGSNDRKVIDSFVTKEEREQDPKLWEQARQVVAKHGALLPLIEEAASKPECQFAVNWNAGAGALFPHLSAMRDIPKFLSANALLNAKDGNMDAALRSVELSFKVSRSLRDDPSIIGQLVRIAIIKISSLSLREILQYGSISEAQAKQLNSTLSQADMLPSLERAMMGERCFGLWGFDIVRGNPASLPTFLQGSGGTARFPALWKALGDVWRPVSYADELIYLKLINEEAELMRRPYREVSDKLDITTVKLPRYALISRVMLPVFARATARRDEGIARIAGSRIVLGLQASKDRYGYYPASLKALETIGWEVPKDPFSGKDFVYQPKGNGFILYSLGENLKDDDAQKYPGPSTGTGAPGREGYRYRNARGEMVADIVWEMDH